jgi:hypothetical protein
MSMSFGASSEGSATKVKQARARRAALATLLCLLGFAGFGAGAMALYPGGTFLDRAHSGQSFFGNFFCDLTQPVSLSGVANPVGSRLAQCGMLFFAGALLGLFRVVPHHFAPGARARPWVLRLGTLAVLTFVAVPLTPSERFGSLHAMLALVAGGFGMLAALVAVRALFASHGRARALAVLGSVALAVAAFDAVIFVQHLGQAAPPPLLVPAAQKVAALLVSAWIAAVALLVLMDKDSRSA